MAQHQRITAFSRWSTLRVIMVLSVFEFVFGLGVGFAFQDQLVPATDPYLAPIRDWLGITTPTLPIPTFAPGVAAPGAAPMAPDASASASAATSVHVAAPPLLDGRARRRVAVPAVMPLGVGAPGTATTTVTKTATPVTITKTPAATSSSTPNAPAPPVITTTEEVDDQHPNDPVRTSSATQTAVSTTATSGRDPSTPPVTGTTEPGTSTVGTSTSSASTSDSPPDLQRVGLAVESERPGGSGTSTGGPSGGAAAQPATDPTAGVG